MKVFKNKKVIISIIVCVAIISIGIIGTILLTDNKKEEEKPKETILLKEELKFEINSELNVLSLISEDNKVKILNEDKTIDTSILGENEITIKYLADDKEEEKAFTILIVDTQAPTIEYQKELSTTAGTKIDLLKDVKVSDNSKEEITATVEGDYDINKVGTYNLKYVAIDSSENKVEEEFTLKVNKKNITSTSSNNSSLNSTNNNSSNNTTSNNTSSNNSNNNTSQVDCSKKYEEWKNLYSGKVFTSKPTEDPNVWWNVARFYVTKEETEDGKIQYHLHNEKISGHNIGEENADAIMQIIGNLSEMRYTKENPIILYTTGGFSCN